MDHTRHSNIFTIPPYYKVGIIGAGGLGATTALALAKMGVNLMAIWDDDVVSDVNIPTQLHSHMMLGKPKVDSIEHILTYFSDEIIVSRIRERVTVETPILEHYNLLISAVDSITSRKAIWEAIHAGEKPDWYLDLRMSAEEYQHFLVQMTDRHPSIHRYAEMLESINEGDIPSDPCTSKATFYTAMTAAAHVGKVLRDIVRNEAMPHRLIHYIADEQIRYFNL